MQAKPKILDKLLNFEHRVGCILPEGAGIGAAIDWGTFLTGVESSRGIGDTFNFPGALLSFALIAYRLFWNQFQTWIKDSTWEKD